MPTRDGILYKAGIFLEEHTKNEWESFHANQSSSNIDFVFMKLPKTVK